jgi:hypothetical protein
VVTKRKRREFEFIFVISYLSARGRDAEKLRERRTGDAITATRNCY